MSSYLEHVVWAHSLLAAPARRYVTSAEEAITVEYDEEKVICRGCLLVMEPSPELAAMEGDPRCGACRAEPTEAVAVCPWEYPDRPRDGGPHRLCGAPATTPARSRVDGVVTWYCLNHAQRQVLGGQWEWVASS